ncbi:MAG: FUSC family protein [Chthoniobacterales bacterium]
MATAPFHHSKTLYAALAIPAGTFLLGFIFWHFGNTDPMWSVTSFILVYDPDMRVAFSMGFGRLLHTLLGVLIAIIAIALFGGLHRWLLPVTLSFTALICGLFLHFRGSWRVVLVTVTLIIGSTLLDPTAGLHIALMRAVEVSTGSILAIIFSRIVAQTRPDTDNIEKPYADPQSK